MQKFFKLFRLQSVPMKYTNRYEVAVGYKPTSHKTNRLQNLVKNSNVSRISYILGPTHLITMYKFLTRDGDIHPTR